MQIMVWIIFKILSNQCLERLFHSIIDLYYSRSQPLNTSALKSKPICERNKGLM